MQDARCKMQDARCKMQAIAICFLVSVIWYLVSAICEPTPQGVWLKVNFHAHAQGKFIKDEGPPIEEVVADYRDKGFDVLVHSAHSNYATDDAAAENWQKEKAHEESLSDPKLLVSLGQELQVAPERRGGRQTHWHIGIVGAKMMVPHQTPFKAACELAHAAGGIVILNHPLVWGMPFSMDLKNELYGLPGCTDKLDAVEVYNTNGDYWLDDSAMYRQIISPDGGGAFVAAVAGCDSHKLNDANSYTMALCRKKTFEALIEAVRHRRTYAVSFDDKKVQEGIELESAGLGQIVAAKRARLSLKVTKAPPQTKVTITLFRNREEVKSVEALSLAHEEAVAAPSAYTFEVKATDADGKVVARAYTSAQWFLPKLEPKPNLTIHSVRLSPQRDGTVRVQAEIVNTGGAAAQKVLYLAFEGLPFAGGRKVDEAVWETFPARNRVIMFWLWRPQAEDKTLLYLVVDPESYACDQDDDTVAESDERDNTKAVWFEP